MSSRVAGTASPFSIHSTAYPAAGALVSALAVVAASSAAHSAAARRSGNLPLVLDMHASLSARKRQDTRASYGPALRRHPVRMAGSTHLDRAGSLPPLPVARRFLFVGMTRYQVRQQQAQPGAGGQPRLARAAPRTRGRQVARIHDAGERGRVGAIDQALQVEVALLTQRVL